MRVVASLVLAVLSEGFAFAQATSCSGTVGDLQGKMLSGAEVQLRAVESGHDFTTNTDSSGGFAFDALPAGSYDVFVRWQQHAARTLKPLNIRAGERVALRLEIAPGGSSLNLIKDDKSNLGAMEGASSQSPAAAGGPQGSGGQTLSSKAVSSLPLNKRDFSQLLVLAGGTQTDTNGSSNFTQQFAVNGQRGTTAVFAMDGIFVSDPEMAGATFSNFNVEAIQEIRSSSGVMPAEIGAGAASYTDVITKSGSSQVHGVAFSFARNSALDARNFFDRRSLAEPGRIPPFIRN